MMTDIFALLFAGQFFFSEPIENDRKLDISIPPPKKEISVNVDINAKSALVMDMDSGMIVYEKDIRTKRPIAQFNQTDDRTCGSQPNKHLDRNPDQQKCL
jgi:D-alanyl-D-alanine carboxypeptidase